MARILGDITEDITPAPEMMTEMPAEKKGFSVEELEGNGADPVKITKRSVDKSVNRLDSAKELIRALDDVEASAVKHINFHNFLCNLSENKLTKKEIIEFLTQ